ncbi:cytochrome b5 domain-containing protein [Candidatus Gracilibacteria bacterium]|nr:cytochrome b5 domain-containing protein [Candidatus Gracilibacteria bacterium]MCF7898636.1 cytochrome b5 domain-containing protein [Candidatus Paceibacterota bacterium]
MKKFILIILGIIAVVGIVGASWYYINFQKYAPDVYVTDTPSGQITTDTVNETVSTTTPTYSMVDVATHKDATSCYSIISDSVYDLTMWVNLHPGGKDKILSICGIDGTERFMKKHKGGEKFMDILTRYKIGELSQ